MRVCHGCVSRMSQGSTVYLLGTLMHLAGRSRIRTGETPVAHKWWV